MGSMAARDDATSSRHCRDRQLCALDGAKGAGGGSPSLRTAPWACDGRFIGGGGSRGALRPTEREQEEGVEGGGAIPTHYKRCNANCPVPPNCISSQC